MGLTYASVYKIFEPQEGKYGPKKLAPYARKAAQNFQATFVMLQKNNIPYPKQVIKEISSLLRYQVLEYDCYAILKISKYHMDMIEDEPLNHHCGKAVSYL